MDDRSLNDRQQRIAELVADGLSDKQIGAIVGLSQPRVNEIVHDIASSLRVDRSKNLRVQIALVVRRSA